MVPRRSRSSTGGSPRAHHNPDRLTGFELEQYSERVYRVLWPLSDTSGGELRRPMAGPAPAGPLGASRLTAGAVPDADMIRAAADALGGDIVNLRRRRAGGQS